jgi:hypothetical protein
MRAAKRVTTLVVVASTLGAAWACSDSAQPLGSGNKFINDTMGQDVYTPPQPAPPPADANSDADGNDSGYAPVLSECASCSCDPAKNYCMSGGVRTADKKASRVSYPYGAGGGFGEPDGAKGPPPPPCPILDAGATGNGCIPLPAACAATPTCECLVVALQPLYSCYLNCSPTPGFLEVYCPHE